MTPSVSSVRGVAKRCCVAALLRGWLLGFVVEARSPRPLCSVSSHSTPLCSLQLPRPPLSVREGLNAEATGYREADINATQTHG